MMAGFLFLLGAGVLLSGEETPPHGSIAGTVVNASQGGVPVGGAEVSLRVNVDGHFVVAAEGLTDKDGKFLFPDIPADPSYVYLPGASWQAVHYAGARVRLDRQRPDAKLQIEVRDAVTEPNPLTVRNHKIILTPEHEALRVNESLLIENATKMTYVGKPANESSRAATLTLSIPPEFTRVTFEKEFFGRRFVVIDERLVTDLPWEPGTRELNFTYLLPNDRRNRNWERSLDLPTSELLVAVRCEHPDEVSCKLPRTSAEADGTIAFASKGLPPGYVLHVQLEKPPIQWLKYAPWGSLIVVAGLIVVSIRYSNRSRRKTRAAATTAASSKHARTSSTAR